MAPLRAAAALAAAVLAAGQNLCPNDANNTTCVIADTVLEFDQSFSLSLNGSLILQNATLLWQPCVFVSSCPNATLAAGGNITIINSTLACSSLIITAVNVSVDANSSILANKMGPMDFITPPAGTGFSGTGGGHAGAGADVLSCRPSTPQPRTGVGGQGFGFEWLTSPFAFGGSSQGFKPTMSACTRGGGRIWLEAVNAMTIAGRVQANGQSAFPSIIPNDCDNSGGGAGGSIYLGAGTLQVTGARFSAVGGDSTETGGGGGGMVTFYASVIIGASSNAVNVTGGATLDPTLSNCPIGGTGLWYRRQLSLHAPVATLLRLGLLDDDVQAVVLRDAAQLTGVRIEDVLPASSTGAMGAVIDAAVPLAPHVADAKHFARYHPRVLGDTGSSTTSSSAPASSSTIVAPVQVTTPSLSAQAADMSRWMRECLAHQKTARARIAHPAADDGAGARLLRDPVEHWQRDKRRLPAANGGAAPRRSRPLTADEAIGNPSATLAERLLTDAEVCLLDHPDLAPLPETNPGAVAAYAEVTRRALDAAAATAVAMAGDADSASATVVRTGQPLPVQLSNVGVTTNSTGVLSCVSQTTISDSVPFTQTIVTNLDQPSISNLVMASCGWDLGQLPNLQLFSLRIGGSSLQTGIMTLQVNGSMVVNDLSRVDSAADSDVLQMSVGGGLTVQQSLVEAGYLQVTAPQAVTVGQLAYLRFAFTLRMSVGSLTLSNIISQVDIPPGAPRASIIAANVTMLQEAQLAAALLQVVVSNSFLVNGLVEALQVIVGRPNCPDLHDAPATSVPAVQNVPCSAPAFNTGFSLWISASNLDVQRSGIVQGATVRVCTDVMTIEGSGMLSAAGLGCPPEAGFGGGSSLTGVGASGAGHGSIGGAGASKEEMTIPGAAYDNATAPSMLGSGGGDTSLGGSGGGLVWIESTSQFSITGTVTGAGNYGQSAVTSSAGGGGGGSGGTLMMKVSNLTGAGTFDFSGGAGGSPGGGGASGGVLNVQWLLSDAVFARQTADFAACVLRHNLDATHGLASPHDSEGLLYGASACAHLAPALNASSFSPVAVDNGFSGSLISTGGSGASPGMDGGQGSSASSPSCGAGEGSALCLPCGVGTSKPESGDNQPCVPCMPGTFMNTTGATSCLPCPPFSVAPLEGSSVCSFCPVGRLPNANYTDCSLCLPGYGGLECLPCAAGSIAPQSSANAPCTPCPAGSAAPADGLASCVQCDVNQYATGEGNTACNACVDGFWSLGNASTCAACPAKPVHADWIPNRNFSGNGTSPWLVAQRVYGAVYSTLSWGRGVSTMLSGSGSAPQPPPASCMFACHSGYFTSSCDLPVYLAYTNLGSYPTFVVIAAVAVLAMVPAWWGCKRPGRRIASLHAWIVDAREQEDLLAEEVDAYWGLRAYKAVLRAQSTACCKKRGSSEPIVVTATSASSSAGFDDASGTPAGRPMPGSLQSSASMTWPPPARPTIGSQMSFANVRGFGPRSASSSVLAFGGGGGGMSPAGAAAVVAGGTYGRPLSLPADEAPATGTGLRVAALGRHMHRIYFGGNNSPSHPLELPTTVPAELAAAFSEVEYAEHVEDCLEVTRWRLWEVRVSNFLRLVWHPLALLFERARRRAHIRALMRLHTEHEHHFIRNTRARALGDGVVFGHSSDGTLAWLDILGTEAEAAEGSVTIGQPRVPAVIPFSGDGTFANPYHIDLSDALVVSQLALMAPDFINIVIGLNNTVRALRGPNMLPGLTLRKRGTDAGASEAQLYSKPASTWLQSPVGGGAASIRDRDARRETVEDIGAYGMMDGGVGLQDSGNGASASLLEGHHARGSSDMMSRSQHMGGPTPQHKRTRQASSWCRPRGPNQSRPLDSQAAAAELRYYIEAINGVLAARRRAALDAVAALSAIEQRMPTAIQRQGSTSLPAHSRSSTAMSLADAALVGSLSAALADAETRADAALRLVPCGFPHSDAQLQLAVFCDTERPCIVMTPFAGPAGGGGGGAAGSGQPPFELPQNVRMLHAPRPKWLAPFIAPGPASAAAAAAAGMMGVDDGTMGAPPRTFSPPIPASGVGAPSGGGGGGAAGLGLARAAAAAGYGDELSEPPPRTTCLEFLDDQLSFVHTYLPGLRTTRASASWTSLTFVMQLFVLLEVSATALLLGGLLLLQPQAAGVFLALPPLIVLADPILGLAAAATGDPLLQRLHASATAASLFPTVLLCLIGAGITVKGTVDVWLGVALTFGLLFVKAVLVHVAAMRVALADLQRDAQAFSPAAVAYVRTLSTSAQEAA